MNSFGTHMDRVKLSDIRLVSERAAKLESQGRRILRLNLGEPDFTTPQHIIAAAAASLNAMETHYSPNRGILPLREAVARKLQADNNIIYDPASEIIITNGCAEALFCAITALADPGDEVIIIEPAFLSYRQITIFAGAVPVTVHASEANGWLPLIEDIEAAITPRTRLLVINTPTNPTGAICTPGLLEQLADLAEAHDLIVISDEVYEKLVFDSEHVSVASIGNMRERTVTINGFSKAYAMTGWRMGYAAAPAGLAEKIFKVHLYSTSCLPAYSQRGALEALINGAPAAKAMRLEYKRRRDLLLGCFGQCPNISCVSPEAAFYMYLNISRSGMDSTTFCRRLLEEKGVAAVPGTAFDSLGRDNIRISFATDETTLRAGARLICELAMEQSMPPQTS